MKTEDHGEDHTIFIPGKKLHGHLTLQTTRCTINFGLTDRQCLFVISYILRNMPVSIYLGYACETRLLT